MLPSGNDASLALATWAGSKLLEESENLEELKTDIEKIRRRKKDETSEQLQERKEKCYKRFISEMNVKAKNLKMKKTNFANSHGLSNPDNKSTAYEMALLCEYCMQNETFRSIVKT